MEAYVPAIEENIPLPKNAQEAFPNLTPTEELNMRAAVVTLMSELTGQPITPNKENVDEAKAIAKEMITNPQYRPDFSKYPNETLAMLAGMVSQMKVLVVDELAELKTYVVNHLIASVDSDHGRGRKRTFKPVRRRRRQVYRRRSQRSSQKRTK